MEERDRIEKNLHDVLDVIDAKFLRKLQAEMFSCASKCFERPNSTRNRDRECYEQCAAKVTRASSVVEHCIDEYQGTIRHCLDSCADSVRYRPDVKPGGNLNSETENILNSCTKKCVDTFVGNKESVVAQVESILKTLPQ